MTLDEWIRTTYQPATLATRRLRKAFCQAPEQRRLRVKSRIQLLDFASTMVGGEKAAGSVWTAYLTAMRKREKANQTTS